MALEIVEYKGYEIHIGYSEGYSSPREDDNVGKIVGSHREYNLVDEDYFSENADNWEDAEKEYYIREYYSDIYEYIAKRSKFVHRFEDWYNEDILTLPNYLDKLIDQWIRQNIVSLNVYLYDHSGISINTSGYSCRWDSGQLGFIYVKKDSGFLSHLKDLPKRKFKEEVTNILNLEIETYNTYIEGDIYEYSIKDEEGEMLDSCCGFYGYNHEESGLMGEARDFIDNI